MNLNDYIRMKAAGSRTVLAQHNLEGWTVTKTHVRSGAGYPSDLGVQKTEAGARALAAKRGALDADTAPLMRVVTVIRPRSAVDPRGSRHEACRDNPLFGRTVIGAASTDEDALALASESTVGGIMPVLVGIGPDRIIDANGHPAELPDLPTTKHIGNFLRQTVAEQRSMIETCEVMHVAAPNGESVLIDVYNDEESARALAGACLAMNAFTPGRVGPETERKILSRVGERTPSRFVPPNKAKESLTR